MDKFLGAALAAFIAVELISLTTFQLPGPSLIWLLLIGVVVTLSTLHDTSWGVYALMAELFVGGKGYLISVPVGGAILSLRMALFIVVFGTWFAKWCVGAVRSRRSVRSATTQWLAPAGLAFMICIGLLQGLLRYPINQIFYDGNAWLFFALLPVVWGALLKPSPVQRVLQLLAAATMVSGVKTLVLLYLFGHHDTQWLAGVYQWVRDTGVGEITFISGSLFRIFFQSHIFALVAWLVFLSLLVQRAFRSRADIIAAATVIYVASLTLLVSQSRSFWVGGVAGFLLISAVAVWRRQLRPSGVAILILLVGYVVSTQLSAVTLISGNYGGNLLADRFRALGREPAASARASQLGPLLDAVRQRPLFGWGFGKQLTYQSQDPRVLGEHPDGWYTTTAFEWGYFDIALKIGLLGLLWYLAWIGLLIARSLAANAPVAQSLGIGLAGIAATNMFTPYLNHPLGIGWVLVTSAVLALPVPKTTRKPAPLP